MAKYTVKDRYIVLLNYNINGSSPISSTKNALVLPQGSTVTGVKQVTNNHKIPFLYFTVDNIKQIQKRGTVGGTVKAGTQYVSPLKHFNATRSAEGTGMHHHFKRHHPATGGMSIEKEYGKKLHFDE